MADPSLGDLQQASSEAMRRANLATGLSSPNAPIQQAAGTLPPPNVIPFPNTPYDRAVIASRQTPSPIDGAAAQIPSPPTTDPIAAAQAAGDPLAPVMAKIGSGESGGSDPYHETYGGGHFGWQGIPNTGSGRFGFVKSTWDEASKAWMAANPGSPAPDFNKPQDQYNVGRFWAAKTYKQQTGRDLAEDARAGKVDYGALAGQWPSLGPDGGRRHREQQTQAAQDLQKLRERQDRTFEQLNQADPHSEERWQLAKQAMETGREYERKALELAERPPSATPIDSMQKLGGLATLVGILGGLLTKTPLTASLNAGGAAMEAYKANDQEAYKRNMDQFKFHVDALDNYAKFELGIYKDILEDERLSSGERMNRLAHQAAILGNEAVQIRAQMGDERAAQQHIDSQRQAHDALDERIRHDRAMEEKGSTGKPGKPQTFEISDPDDPKKKIQISLTPGSKPGEWFTLDGKPYTLPGNARPLTASQMGARESIFAQRGITSGSDVRSDLKNITELPALTTRGLLSGFASQPPVSMLDAAQKNLANLTLTSEAAGAMTDQMVGVARALASLETGGVYVNQHLVDQYEKLAPQAGDSGLRVLRKLGIMRQNAENALEGMVHNPRMSDDQREYVREIVEAVSQAIPWTPHDVNQLEFHGGENDTILDYAKKQGLGSGGAVTEDHPDRIQNGVHYTWRNGQYEPVGQVQ